MVGWGGGALENQCRKSSRAKIKKLHIPRKSGKVGLWAAWVDMRDLLWCGWFVERFGRTEEAGRDHDLGAIGLCGRREDVDQRRLAAISASLERSPFWSVMWPESG